MANEFPPVWFETFLAPGAAAPVHRELAFIREHLPAATFPNLLDIPCGIGRHAGPLSALGYTVVGVDRSPSAIAVARERYPNVEFLREDMFNLDSVAWQMDGVLCLWQSFGYGDSGQNRGLLSAMRSWLRPGGRLLIDLYNADAARALPSQSNDDRGGRTVTTTRSFSSRRMRVELRYSDADVVDVHDWEIYRPDEFQALAGVVDLEVLVRCAWFDPEIPPSAEHLRMQFLLERPRR